jgi:hypothetical protein
VTPAHVQGTGREESTIGVCTLSMCFLDDLTGVTGYPPARNCLLIDTDVGESPPLVQSG